MPIMVGLIALTYGCGPLEIQDTQENTVDQPAEPSHGAGKVNAPNAVVHRPKIQSHHATFYHESQRSRVSIRYRNAGLSPANHVRTDLAVFMDGDSVPIEKDTVTVPTLAPSRGLELRGALPDSFFEGVMNGKATLLMEFTVRYQDEQGQEFEASSTWQFSRSTMEFFLLEERAN
ncbi:MAG: hypothetical protein ABI988_07770 [Nitrospirota bacterium]